MSATPQITSQIECRNLGVGVAKGRVWQRWMCRLLQGDSPPFSALTARANLR